MSKFDELIKEGNVRIGYDKALDDVLSLIDDKWIKGRWGNAFFRSKKHKKEMLDHLKEEIEKLKNGVDSG